MNTNSGMIGRIMRVSPKLRFVEREIQSEDNPSLCRRVKILQQAWSCIDDGSMYWVDVPLESEAV